MNLAAYAADVDTADIEYIKDQKSPLRDFFDAPMTAAGHAAHGHFLRDQHGQSIAHCRDDDGSVGIDVAGLCQLAFALKRYLICLPALEAVIG